MKKKTILIAVIACVVAAAAGIGIKYAVDAVKIHEVEANLPSKSASDFVDTISDVMKENYGAGDELYCLGMTLFFDHNGNVASSSMHNRILIGDTETGTDYYVIRVDDKEDNPQIIAWDDGEHTDYGSVVYLPMKTVNEVFKNVNFAELAKKYIDERCSEIQVEYDGEYREPYGEYKEAEKYDFEKLTFIYTDGEIKQVFNSSEIKTDCLSLNVGDWDYGISRINILIPIE